MGEQIKAQRSLRKIAGVTLNESAVQWYCFLLYGTAAGTVFNKVFFSVTGDEITALIMSYMSFAIGCAWRNVLVAVEPGVVRSF